MVAINFSVFQDKIIAGTKRQTIRANDRNGQIRAGVKLQLYTGMRTKNCRKLLDNDPFCKDVYAILITRHTIDVIEIRQDDGFKDIGIMDWPAALESFAQKDGFENWADMLAFFDKKYGLPFTGVLIRW